MSQLNRKCLDRIIRIGIYRGVTEQNDVETRTNLRLFFLLAVRTLSRNSSYTLSSERGIREYSSYTFCRLFYLFYKRNV